MLLLFYRGLNHFQTVVKTKSENIFLNHPAPTGTSLLSSLVQKGKPARAPPGSLTTVNDLII